MAEKKKLIDEKGKLFGKVNLIDLIVLALILVVAVVVGLKMTGRGPVLPGSVSTQSLRYTVAVDDVSQTLYDAVVAEVEKGGDSVNLMASGSIMAGCYVESVTSRPYLEDVQKEDGTIVLSEKPGYVCAVFTIHATVTNPVTRAISTQEVRVGKYHIVKTTTFELENGVIESVDVLE